MIQLLLKVPLPCFLFLTLQMCYAQDDPVVWRFEAGPVKDMRTALLITANVAPGWHLYSQSIKEGGPIPTRFRFEPDDDYARAGGPEEKGNNSKKFYDETYEMEITWYTGVVSFEQRITLNKPRTIIKGKVEYMTCNNEVCIPAEQEFSVHVSP